MIENLSHTLTWVLIGWSVFITLCFIFYVYHVSRSNKKKKNSYLRAIHNILDETQRGLTYIKKK